MENLVGRGGALVAAFVVAGLGSAWAQERVTLVTPFQEAVSHAEQALREQEYQTAESWYHEAMLEGWLLVGGVEVNLGNLDAALTAYERAMRASVTVEGAWLSLAEVHLLRNEPAEAISYIRKLITRRPTDIDLRQLLARAMSVKGDVEQAVQELEEALILDPEREDVRFSVAAGYLELGNLDRAKEYFDRIVQARPIPQTHIIIGRTYRDFKFFDLAREEAQKALEQDPAVPHAHFLLATIDLNELGAEGTDKAFKEFEQEVEIVPDDPASNLFLGSYLVEAREYEKAIPLIEKAVSDKSARFHALRFLGTALLGVNRTPEAIGAFQQALVEAETSEQDAELVSRVHYSLARSLRMTGDQEGSRKHFALAKKLSQQSAEESRENLAAFLSDEAGQTTKLDELTAPIEALLLASMGQEQQIELKRALTEQLVRAYLNVGILKLKGGFYHRAAVMLEQAAEIDPELELVNRPLGIAYFNAGDYAAAVQPLQVAYEQQPDDADLRRMLAMALFSVERFAEAVELFAKDDLESMDRSTIYSYGVSLRKSGQSEQAEAVFKQMLQRYGDWPELQVLLGQIQADESDFKGALKTLERALALDPAVKGAHGAIGHILMREGELERAETELVAELERSPEDQRARYIYATVLDMSGKPEQVVEELHVLLKKEPRHADGRYLLGKTYLKMGQYAAAAEQLQIAAELSPDDYNIHYQLGQAYQRLGKRDQAKEQFDIFREIKKDETRTAPVE